MTEVLTKKHFFSWLVSTVSMFLLSNLYHNIILNDFDRILYPKPFFYSSLLIAYSGISLVGILIYSLNFFSKLGPHFSAFLIGSILGITTYAITITMGFSFNNSLSMQQNMLDVLWQVIEQGIGLLVGAICYQIIEKGGFFIHI
jgi:hypothetical protein